MSKTALIIIENASFIAIFLLCLYGAISVRKHAETVPGADLLLIGFLVYAGYGMLSWGAPGFVGSFIEDWTQTAGLGCKTALHFVAYGMRLSLLLILVGILKIGRGLKT